MKKNMKKNMKRTLSVILITAVVFVFCYMPISIRVSAATNQYFNGTYVLRSALNNNKVMDANGRKSVENGTNIELCIYNGGINQKYEITHVGSGWHKIICVWGNKAVDVWGAVRENETNVALYDWNGGDNQLWRFIPDGNGYYYIQNKMGLYLDVWNNQTADGTNIQTYQFNGGNNQRWKVETDSAAKTVYTTITLGSFSNLDQWKKQMQYAEQKVIGIPQLRYNLSGSLTNYGKMITGKTVLEYKTVSVTHYEYGRRVTTKYRLPSKIRFKLHKHDFKQTVWFDFTNLSITQTCGCGESSQMQWKVPYPLDHNL